MSSKPQRYEYLPGNQVRVPRIRKTRSEDAKFREMLYETGQAVEIVIYYDDGGPPTLVASSSSSDLLDELFNAAKCKAVIVSMLINGAAVTPSSIVRINHFVSQPGWSSENTFRGWRRKLMRRANGLVLWKTVVSWREFLEKTNTLTHNPKSPVKK